MKQEQKIRQAAYQKMVEEASPKSEKALSIVKAFLVGGLICTIGQAIKEAAFAFLGMDQEGAALFTTVVMIFMGATLTGLGVYDRIGKFAGAGSIVPITGFANSVVAPAMEFRREGFITGIGAKMFILAGPVLVYGTLASIAIGVLSHFLGG